MNNVAFDHKTSIGKGIYLVNNNRPRTQKNADLNRLGRYSSGEYRNRDACIQEPDPTPSACSCQRDEFVFPTPSTKNSMTTGFENVRKRPLQPLKTRVTDGLSLTEALRPESVCDRHGRPKSEKTVPSLKDKRYQMAPLPSPKPPFSLPVFPRSEKVGRRPFPIRS